MKSRDLVYPRERVLGLLTLVLGSLVWVGIVVGTFGVALLFLLIGFLLYVFVQSALISYVKGNGVELSAAQFPDLHRQFEACCERLQLKSRPKAYVINGNGGFNAFATVFLGSEYVVLFSDVVDAMDQHPDGVSFYVGHELGHLRMKHLRLHFLRWPVLWLPLLGAAYSRARESTCDRHGLACSSSPTTAAQALAALAAGGKRWAQIDLPAFHNQAKDTSGFWMSFHELAAGYPWVTKRVVRVMNLNGPVPRRNPFAYLFALFVPYAGPLGAGFSLLVTVYIVGVLAAVALPAYQDYTVRAKIATTHAQASGLNGALGEYFVDHGRMPGSLEEARLPATLPDGSKLSYDADAMTLTVSTIKGELIYTPMKAANGRIQWRCEGGEETPQKYLPRECRATASVPEGERRR